MLKNPCYKCSKRHLKCHSDCPDYADWQAEQAKINAARKKDIETDIYITEEAINRGIKWRKSQQR